MELWPGSLQDLLNVDNFSVKFGDTLIRSDNDVGPSKVRARYTDGVDIYTCSIDLLYEDFETLRDFYKTTLGNGALTFAFTNPLTGDADEWRFTAPPDIRPLGSGGRYFRVTMSWELLP
jgi:hypothetical protein